MAFCCVLAKLNCCISFSIPIPTRKDNYFGGAPKKPAGLAPHFNAFRAVGANINVLAALQHLASEAVVGRVTPKLLKALGAQGAQRMLRILIEAAGHHVA